MNHRSIVWRLAVAASLALVAASTACHDRNAHPETDRIRLETGTFGDDAEEGGDPLEVRYGTLTVPADRRDPRGVQLALSFIVFPSTARKPGPPIVFLAGGPGGSGIEEARGEGFPLFDALRARADVIAFDQRGTGASEPVDATCFETVPLPLDQPLDRSTLLERSRSNLEECLIEMDRRAIDPGWFTTVESADDLEDLRAGLGAARIALVGTSYGTHLALAAARRHPDGIDRMVLAGVEGPDHTFKLPSNIQQHLERLARVADSDPIVAERMPDFLATLGALLDRLERKPVKVELLGGRTVVVGPLDLQKWLADQMGSRSGMSRMPEALFLMSQGEFLELGNWAYRFRQAGRRQVMPIATDCASYASGERLDRIAKEDPETLLGATIDLPFPGICDVEGLPRLDDGFRTPLRSSIPTLFISGTLDGRTPPRNAEEVASGFEQASRLTVERAAHGRDLFFSSSEILGLVDDFLAGELEEDRIVEGPRWQFSPLHSSSLEREVLGMLTTVGYERSVPIYRELRERHEGDGTYDFGENVLNILGYELLQSGETDLAIDVFRLNTEAYPDAFNPWDSLGEGFMVAGDREQAIENYEKSLELNPNNRNAVKILRELRADP